MISVYFCSLGLVKKSMGIWRGVYSEGSQQQEDEGAHETPSVLCLVCRSGRQPHSPVHVGGVSRVKSGFDGAMPSGWQCRAEPAAGHRHRGPSQLAMNPAKPSPSSPAADQKDLTRKLPTLFHPVLEFTFLSSARHVDILGELLVF